MSNDITAEELFTVAVEYGASDIHIKAGSPPKLRIDGELTPLDLPAFTAETAKRIIYQTMSPAAAAKFSNDKHQADYAYVVEGVGRFRAQAFMTRKTVALAARFLPARPLSLDELGSPPNIRNLIKNRSGLIIVCGATGSGKSTLMAGLINEINEMQAMQIISIEDPIEFIHEDKNSSIAQREIGEDVISFEDAVQASLREDPDIILVGETRSAETMKAALHAAETGHLVITTLHTNDSVEAINRIMDLLSDDKLAARRALAVSLRGIVAQRLIRTNDGSRKALNEIMINTEEIAELIGSESFEAPRIRKILDSSASQGMQSFELALATMAVTGQLNVDEARMLSSRPLKFDEEYRRLSS